MSPAPIYEVIRNDIFGRIKSGELSPGARLPSESSLAAQYGVSRMTVRQAVDQLESEYLVHRRRGSGTFVTAQPFASRRLNRLGSFREEIEAGEADIRSEIRQREITRPDEDIRTVLGLKEGQDVVMLLRLRTVDGTPAAIQQSWLPYTAVPQLGCDDLVDGSLYTTLREKYGVRLGWAEQQISAVDADTWRAEWLGLAPGAPLISITRVTHTVSSAPVEYARSWTRPEFPLIVRLES